MMPRDGIRPGSGCCSLTLTVPLVTSGLRLKRRISTIHSTTSQTGRFCPKLRSRKRDSVFLQTLMARDSTSGTRLEKNRQHREAVEACPLWQCYQRMLDRHASSRKMNSDPFVMRRISYLKILTEISLR